MLVEIAAYFAIFWGVFFEGELFLISALVANISGRLDTSIISIVAFLAGISSDVFYFTLARKKGLSWVNSKPKFKKILPKARNLLNRYQRWILLSYRFMYGLRSIVPILFGLNKISFTRFVGYAILGNLIWVATITYLGLTFGSIIIEQFSHIEHVEKWVIGISIAIGLMILITIKRKELPKIFGRKSV